MSRPSATRRRLARRAVLALAVAALAACGGGSGSGETTATGDGGLPALAAPTIAGDTIDLADYAGEDLVVWFWAPW